MEELFKQLAEDGGAIVSTKDCSQLEIAYANANGKMWVDEFGCGFVLRSQLWLDLTKWRENAMATRNLTQGEIDEMTQLSSKKSNA